MNYALRQTLLGCALVFLASPDAHSQSRSTAQLRYYAFALTDHAPSVEDAKAVAKGELAMDEAIETMLASDAHLERVRRYFHDWFGFLDYPGLLLDDTLLHVDENDIYQRTDGLVPCGPDDTIEMEAWWLDPGQTLTTCTNLGPTDACVEDEDEDEDEEDAEEALECGCGELMLGCIPIQDLPAASSSLSQEFGHRAVEAYTQDRTWFELLGGDYLYANRYVYHYYLYTGSPNTFPPGTQEQVEALRSVGLHSREVIDFPEGAERAGVVTSPMFLTRFNNFRSRIRALTGNLLCRDVTGESNVDQTTTFYNEDLDELTLSHADNPECSYCHYPMDNMGSTIMHWEEEGTLYEELSTVGHVYGETGEGPAFLMRGYIERAPEFMPCMAKRAWESFSGASWDDLPEEQQAAFTEEAKLGPRNLLQKVMLSPLMRELRR
jgi:hypothetical protein